MKFIINFQISQKIEVYLPNLISSEKFKIFGKIKDFLFFHFRIIFPNFYTNINDGLCQLCNISIYFFFIKTAISKKKIFLKTRKIEKLSILV